MVYKLYFDVVICDKQMSDFMRACDLCDGIGVRATISIKSTIKPTEEYIKKLTKTLENTKNHNELKQYFVDVKYIQYKVGDLHEN